MSDNNDTGRGDDMGLQHVNVRNCATCGHLENTWDGSLYPIEIPQLECNYHCCVMWHGFDFEAVVNGARLPGNTICPNYLSSTPR
jgi:hypothetical protein